MDNVDRELFFFLNDLAGRYDWLDSLMVFNATALIYIIFAVAGGLLVWRLNQKEYRKSICFLLCLVIAYGLLQLIGFLDLNDRPYVMYEAVTQLVAHDAERSFASNHAGAGFGVALAAMAFLHRKAGWALAGFAGLVSLGRIFAGLHHPVDIFGALVVAIVAAMGVYYGNQLLEKYQRSRQTPD